MEIYSTHYVRAEVDYRTGRAHDALHPVVRRDRRFAVRRLRRGGRDS